MERVIDGKKYSTETATLICQLPSTEDSGSFDWHDTALYRSPKGTYFLAGRGGARSLWAKQVGTNSWGSGSGMQLLTQDDARAWAEKAGLSAEQMARHGFVVTEG